MAYSISRSSIIRNLPQLNLIYNAKGDIRFETTFPRRLAHKLREAIASCKEFPEFEHLHDEIKANYKIKEKPNAVIAEYDPVSIGISTRPDDDEDDRSVVTETKGTIVEATQMLDVIGGGIEGDKLEYLDIHFPNVILGMEDLAKLYDWTETTDWEIINHQEKGLSLTKRVEEFGAWLWKPE